MNLLRLPIDQSTNRLVRATICVLFISFAVAGCERNRVSNRTEALNAANDLNGRNVSMPIIPKLDPSYWINSTPDVVDRLEGKVVLVDFWEYTCVDCIRTLPGSNHNPKIHV